MPTSNVLTIPTAQIVTAVPPGGSVLRLLERDLVTVLWDFNDPTGAANPYGVRTDILGDVDLGDVSDERAVFPHSDGGGEVVYDRQGNAGVVFSHRMRASSYENFRKGAGQLVRYLRNNASGRVLQLRPFNATEDLYIDYLPRGPFTNLLRGQSLALYKVARLLDDTNGYPVRILRQPWFRIAELDPTVNKLTANPSLLMGATSPDGWTRTGTAPTSEAYDATEDVRVIVTAGGVATYKQVISGAAAGQNWAVSLLGALRAGAGSWRIGVQFLTAGDADLGTTWTTPQTASQLNRVQVAATAPATTAKVTLVIELGANSTFWVTDGQLEQGTVATTFRTPALAIPNDPAVSPGRIFLARNVGDEDTPYVATFKGDVGSLVSSLLVARRASEDAESLLDWVNETCFGQLDASGRGWTIALSNDTTPVADIGISSGGNAAQTTHATNPTTMAKRIRMTRTTKLDSLRGKWRAVVRLRATAASKHTVQLRESPSLADPVLFSHDEVPIDLSSASTFGYEDVDLGEFEIPEESDLPLAGLALELWSRRDSGTGNLLWDFLFLVPVTPDKDDVARIIVPDQAKELTLGALLVSPVSDPSGGTAGTVDGNALKLDTTTDNAGELPSGGRAVAAGRHVWRFDLENRTPQTNTVICRVRRVGGPGTTVATTTVSLAAGEKKLVELPVDISDASLYEGQVDDPGLGGGGSISVNSIGHEFKPVITENEQIRSDPERDDAYKIDANGNLLTLLKVDGRPPLRLKPKLNAVVVIPGDRREAGHPNDASTLGRTLTVAGKGAPRFSVA